MKRKNEQTKKRLVLEKQHIRQLEATKLVDVKGGVDCTSMDDCGTDFCHVTR